MKNLTKIILLILFIGSTNMILLANETNNLGTNNSFQGAKIKTKANKGNAIGGGCYIYVAIFSNAMWDEMREKFMSELEVKKNICKKITIYQTIQGVYDMSLTSIMQSNFSRDEYKLDLGVILEERYSNLDIEIITLIANSDLGVRGIGDDKVNTGIVLEEDNVDTNNRYKASTTIINSNIGKEDIITQAGIDLATNFLKEDSDNPFNDKEEDDE